MADFDLEEFFENPSVEVLKPLRKADWVSLAKRCDVSYKIYWKKAKIQNAVVEYLIDAEHLGDQPETLLSEELEVVNVEDEKEERVRKEELEHEREMNKMELSLERKNVQLEREMKVQIEKEKVQIEREKVQIEGEKLQIEKEKLQLEMTLKREVEMEKLKLEKTGRSLSGFKAEHAIKSVPVFVESEVE